MSQRNSKDDELFTTIQEMFGSQHSEKIRRALETCERDQNESPNAESAIEIMFELINNETSPTGDQPAPSPNLAGAVVPMEQDPIVAAPSKFLPENFERVVKLIDKGYKVLVLLRGLPGSGKSHLASEIVKRCGGKKSNHIFSADDFFRGVNGIYYYDVNRLSEAHQWNQTRTHMKMRSGWSPIIIDNTNLKQWEMFPYVKFAITYHYVIEILEPVTPWATNAGQLERRNAHNVPKAKIRKMMDNYERSSVQKLLQILDCESHIGLEPALRDLPPLAKNGVDTNPKPQRSQFDGLEPTNEASLAPPSTEEMNWQTFEEDNFWNKYDKKLVQSNETKFTKPAVASEPKPPRHNLLKSLKEAAMDVSPVRKVTHNEESKVHVEFKHHKKNCLNENNTFREIRQMFPNIGNGYLWDLFVKCGGDGDWVTDILFQDEFSFNYEAENKNELECDCDKPVEPKQSIPTPKPVQARAITREVQQKKSDVTAESTSALEAAKRLIEQQFVISDTHYSDHTRRIRNRKHPKPDPPPQIPSTSSEQVPCDPAPPEEEEEIIEVNLGNALVQQLEQMFGTNVLSVEKDDLVLGDLKLSTKVFMQKSLALEMYALWSESLYAQLEEQKQTAVRVDLELARELDSKERYPGLFRDQPPKDLKDIIDIEMSLAAYRQDISKWKDEVPNNMATRFARDKLRVIFPNIDPDLLDEMLAAHKNDVNETIRVLQTTISDTDVIERRSKQLFAQAQDEINELSEGYNEFERSDELDLNSKLTLEEAKRSALRDFQDCRNIAQHHNQLRAECYAKARNAIQRNEHGVALYYGQIAELHKKKIDFYNHKAANRLMEAHNVSQTSTNTLDLHYLHTTEAAQCLDLFLDKHINKLQARSKFSKHVFVITGRGMHSLNGIPTIKIRVKQRLKDRELKYSEVNPGLLKVKLMQNSKFASNC